MTEIYIIADCSGSMAEWGKKELIEYHLHSINNYVQIEQFNDFHFRYYSWNDSISELDNTFSMKTSGKSDTKRLIEFMTKSGSPTLLLSDGNFTVDRNTNANGIKLVSVAVGCEQNIAALKKISANVYNSESILNAVTDLCFGGE